MKKYGLSEIVFLVSCLLCLGLSGCRGCRKIVYVTTKDSTSVRPGLVFDTVVVWRKIRDTFQTKQITVYRTGDTFRYFYRERNCTTYTSKTIVQPERVREVTKEGRPGALDKITNTIAALVAFLAVLVILRNFKR